MVKGFVIIEIIISFTIISLVILPLLSIFSVNYKLDMNLASTLVAIANNSNIMEHFARNNIFEDFKIRDATVLEYGNYFNEFIIKSSEKYPFSIINTNLSDFIGNDFCRIDFDEETILNLKSLSNHSKLQYDIGHNNFITDLIVKGNLLYLTADSSVSSYGDLFIIDFSNDTGELVTSLNTGPGTKSFSVVTRYVYLANISTVSTFQVVNIENYQNPKIIYSMKMPQVSATSTSGTGVFSYYYRNHIFLGLTKNSGLELNIIDISEPNLPKYVTGIELNTQVNSVLIYNNTLYIASPNVGLSVYNISDISNPVFIKTYYLSGQSVMDGKSLYRDGEILYLGRTVGGFNNTNNHEFYKFDIRDPEDPILISSFDFGTTINDIFSSKDYSIVSTIDNEGEVKLFNHKTMEIEAQFDLPGKANKIVCHNKTLYIGLDSNEVYRIKLSSK
jgi:hypothetical protein